MYIPSSLNMYILWRKPPFRPVRNPRAARNTTLFFFFVLRRMVIKIKLKLATLPHIYNRICVVCQFNSVVHNGCCSTQRCSRGNGSASCRDIGRVSMSTRPDPAGGSGAVEIATRSHLSGLCGNCANPPAKKKPRLHRLPAGLGPVHPTR